MSLFSALAIGGGSLVGAGASYLGSREAARAAESAGDTALAIYQQQRRDLAPYRSLGKSALNRMRDIYLGGTRDFTTAPGYDFRFGEGAKAVERGAAARGRQLSGPQLKALMRYGQGVAADEYDRGFNRLAVLSGFGPQAVSQGNLAGANFAVNAGNAAMNAARARASGYEGIGSSINQGINNALVLRAMQGIY